MNVLVGERVGVPINPERLHLFEQDTGGAI